MSLLNTTIANLSFFTNHFDGKTTIVYKDWIWLLDGYEFFHADDCARMFKTYHVPSNYRQDINNALAGKVEPLNLAQLSATQLEDVLNFAVHYCLQFDGGADNAKIMRQIILDSKNPRFAFMYYHDAKDDADMRQMIVDSGELRWIVEYCIYAKERNKIIDDDPKIIQAIVEQNNAKYAYEYCLWVAPNPKLRDVILTSAQYACRYCKYISNDADMRQAIIDSGDPVWGYWYRRNVSNDAEMCL